MEKQNKSWIVNVLSVIVILGVFAISCLFLANLGVSTYKNVIMTNDTNFELRTSLNYVATKVRQTDTFGYPRILNVEGVDCLILGEEIDNQWYETIIYYKDGYLYELFQEADQEYHLDYASEAMEVNKFSIAMDEQGMLYLVAENKSGEQQTLALDIRSRR